MKCAYFDVWKTQVVSDVTSSYITWNPALVQSSTRMQTSIYTTLTLNSKLVLMLSQNWCSLAADLSEVKEPKLYQE